MNSKIKMENEMYKIKKIYNTARVLDNLFDYIDKNKNSIVAVKTDDEIDKEKLCWALVNHSMDKNTKKLLAYTPDSTSYLEYAVNDLKNQNAMVSYKHDYITISYPDDKHIDTYTFGGLRKLKPVNNDYDVFVLSNADKFDNSLLETLYLCATINQAKFYIIGSNNRLHENSSEKSIWLWLCNHPNAECIEVRN